MSSQSVRLFKGLLASAGIVGFGYFLLEKTVSSGADIYKVGSFWPQPVSSLPSYVCSASV
jgi:hypothetical protein